MSTESRQLVNYYHILDVKRNATQDEIEMAYAKMALKHHPDVAGDKPEVQERFAMINKAYSVLSDPAKKAEYNETLGISNVSYQEEVITGQEGSRASASDSPAAAPAKKRIRTEQPAASGAMSRKKLDRVMGRARKLIAKGDFWRADAQLREAAASYPRDPDIRRLLARSAEGRGRLREAVEELKAAVDIEYFNPENHYLMGKIYLKANQLSSADKAFRDALSWQEDYRPALKGLEEIRALRRKSLPWWKKLLGGVR